MFDRIAKSFQLAKDSWGVLTSNKRFMLFPMLSGLACLLVLLSFFVPLYLVRDQLGGGQKTPIWVYLMVFGFYFCTYFVIIFFNAALVSCALLKFNGEDATLGDGLRAACRCLPQILAWALVSATVGLLLKAIENSHEKAGQIVSAILGTAWTFLTFFVVPVLVVEKVGPFQAIGRSVSLLKKTWGETLFGHFGIGLFAFLLFIPIFLLGAASVYLLSVSSSLGLMLLVVTAILFLIWAAACSALSGIYTSALYQYAAHERIPQGFDEAAIKGAMYGKK